MSKETVAIENCMADALILNHEISNESIRKVLEMIMAALNMQRHLAAEVEKLRREMKGDFGTVSNIIRNHYDDINTVRNNVESLIKELNERGYRENAETVSVKRK